MLQPRFCEERWRGLTRAEASPGRLRVLDYDMHPELLAESGPISVHPDDRAYGALVAGVQGVGKTSLLLRQFANDLLDGDAAQIVIDPKPELVERCVELIPPDCPKEVWYLDLGDPAFGINPLRVYRDVDFKIEVAAVAESVVAALLAMFEGQIFQSSKRYLYPAVIGALAIARCHPRMEEGLLEHAYALLRPQASGMHQVAALCCQRLGLERTAQFFSTELRQDLQASPQRVSDRMDPPANKISGLLDREPLRRFFQHPYDLSISEIMERRGILLVNAGRGRIGTENAQACMHFIFQLLDRHMQRQMEVPEERRPRVAVICDEAHYLFTRGVIKQVATHRAAGLDMTAGIQYLSQLGADAQSQAATAEIRDGVSNLLQSKFLFRLSEPHDADEVVRIAMAVVSTLTQQDPDSRIQRRITPEVMMNIENHYCVASQIIAGSRGSAYIGRTYPMARWATDWAEHQLRAMRARLGPVAEGFVRSISELTDHELLFKEIGASAGEVSDADPSAGASAPAARRCPQCGKRTVIKGKRQYGGGWVCWRRTGGCGQRFTDGDQAIESQDRAGTEAPAAGATPTAVPSERPTDTPSETDAGAPQASMDASGDARQQVTAEPSSAPQRPYGPVPVRHAYGRLDSEAPDPRFESPALAVFGKPAKADEPERGEAPASLRELTLADRLLGISAWAERAAAKEPPKLADVELAIVKLLDRGGVLLAPIIARACMPGKAERTVRYRLGKLFEAGLIARTGIHIRDRARNEATLPFAYRLTAAGFRAAQRQGAIDAERDWRPVEVGDRAMTVPHDQHAIAWVTALARLLGDRIVSDNWRTPRSQHGVIAPPLIGEGRARHQLTPVELHPPAPSYGFDGAYLPASPNDRFSELRPDASVEIRIPGTELRFDVLLELTLGAKPSHNQRKFRAYDSFLLGWWREHRRYRHLKGRPVVVMVFSDMQALAANATLADRELDGRLGVIGLPQPEWWHPGRAHTFFALEEDVHYGSLRCFALPSLPRQLREQLGSDEPLLRRRTMLPETMVEGRLQ